MAKEASSPEWFIDPLEDFRRLVNKQSHIPCDIKAPGTSAARRLYPKCLVRQHDPFCAINRLEHQRESKASLSTAHEIGHN